MEACATELSEAGSVAVPGTGTFYRIDYRHGTLREFWWGNRGPVALLTWALAKLGRSAGGSTDDPNVESLIPFEVGEDSIPADLREPFAQLRAELEALGFIGPPIIHFIDDPLHRTRTTMLSLAHREAECFARVHLRVWKQLYPAKTYLFTEIISELRNNGFLWSLSSHPDAIAPSSCRVNRIEGGAPQQLWESHRASLFKLKSAGTVVPVVGGDGLRRATECHHVALRDFHLGRGFFQPLTQADRDNLVRLRTTRPSTAAGDDDDAEVLADIESLQNARTNWKQGLLTLVVSLALFLAIGLGGDWESTLLLVPILLFHELGHWVAMRYFGYRNLRMFFIPLFGAAVSGQHYNVAAWKKAVVSLMGPVPGILAGSALGGVGMYTESKPLIDAAAMMLVINGLNLLPFLPFDGGWVAHSLLFSRHWLLEISFRVAAIGALAAASTLAGDYLLSGLAVLMAIGLVDSYRMARISYDLRRSGWRAVSNDDQSIPPDIARVIIARVKAGFPKVAPSKTIAQRTLMLFESVNAKPAGWIATTALAGVQLSSFLLALVVPIVLYAGPEVMRGLGRFYNGASIPFRPSELRIAHGAPIDPLRPRAALVASFASATEASAAFERLRPTVEPMTSLLLIGSSLVLSLPADEVAIASWFERIAEGAVEMARSEPVAEGWLDPAGPKVDEAEHETIADPVASEAPEETDVPDYRFVSLALRCEMPTPEDADRAREGVEGGSFSLLRLPPWAFAELPADGRVEGYRSARATYAAISAAVEDDPRVEAAWEAVHEAEEPDANLTRDVARVSTEAFRREARAWLERPNPSDSSLVREMLSLLDSAPANADDADLEQRLEIGLREFLGSFTEAQLDSNPQLARHAAICSASSNEREVRIDGFEFVDLAFATHSMIGWLAAEGCRNFHYDI